MRKKTELFPMAIYDHFLSFAIMPLPLPLPEIKHLKEWV